ncbi:bacteriocin-associated integral membrane family protein [Aerococcaceae bacterium zg-BR9]|uniref:DUF1430 domain-containing protein n=1 Tax=Aerococcaceae bacterium zg-1292 TaxID=2774330 RepID=UPI004063346C|nr:bacteriocin-associated integral membrane family protein [Aerococcaceae bacterium zg-BR9]
MKRIFVLLSNILVSFFLVSVLSIWSDTYVSHYYPNVSVFDASNEVSFDKVAQRLTQLANETNSFIAMQHQESNSEGVSIFSYTTFGSGELSKNLLKKSVTEARKGSVETNYFIFKGNLTVERLRDELHQLSLSKFYVTSPSHLKTLISIFGNGFQIIGVLIFCLTFASLSIISQIKTLKSAGLRLIAGEHRWIIFLRTFVVDMCNVLLGIGIGLVIALFLKLFISYQVIGFSTILIGLLVYNLLLLTISLFFSMLFAIGIRRIHLMQVIKGQVPTKGIISLILLGQFLAIVIISIGISRILIYSNAWKQQHKGQEAWTNEKALVTLSLSRDGVESGFSRDAIEKQKQWYQIMNQAVSMDKAMVVRHFLAEQFLRQGVATSDNHSFLASKDYSPQGIMLLVTPQYLERQNIDVPQEIKAKLAHLTSGEFVMFLPEQLRSEAAKYKRLFEDQLTEWMSSKDVKQKMTATLCFLEPGHERFIYNTTPVSYQQFLIDPIMIVLTPQSTGPQSYLFWEQALQGYTYFTDLSHAQELIQANGLEKWVGEYQSGHQIYQNLLQKIQREVWVMVAETVLSMFTAILMFYTMNRVYFEEFRRNILIKRIAGLHFLEIHAKYLLAQLLAFLVAFVMSVIFKTEIRIAIAVLMLFIGLSALQLSYQVKLENRMTLRILKGG